MSGTQMATLACGSCGTLNRVDLARAAHHPKCGSCGARVPLDRTFEVGDASLEKVVKGTGVPILVDFHAEWCGPCKVMAPVLEEIARDRAGSALVAKLDTDRNPAMAVRFAIRGIPTLIAFRHGREVAREVGAVPRPRLEALLDRAAEA
jgi:thioredoxin 2